MNTDERHAAANTILRILERNMLVLIVGCKSIENNTCLNYNSNLSQHCYGEGDIERQFRL